MLKRSLAHLAARHVILTVIVPTGIVCEGVIKQLGGKLHHVPSFWGSVIAKNLYENKNSIESISAELV